MAPALLLLSLVAAADGSPFGTKEGVVRPLTNPDFKCPLEFPHLDHYHDAGWMGLWCFANNSPKGTGPSCNIVTDLPPPLGKSWGSNPSVQNCVEGSDVPKARHRGDTCSKGEPVDPTLLIWGHWDIIVKAVYASFYLRFDAVPIGVERAYLQIIEVWNKFKEGCHGTATHAHGKNCKAKNSATDFTSAFHRTIKSMDSYGFDASKAIVMGAKHKTRLGFAHNGAHRTGVGIATGQAICVQWGQRHSSVVIYGEHYLKWGWDLHYFMDLGYQSKFVDETMEHWLAIDKRSVVVVLHPQAVAQDGAKWAGARKILEQCSVDNHILLHKDVAMNAAAMQHLLLTEHGGEGWTHTASLLEKEALSALVDKHNERLTNPVARFVVIRGGKREGGWVDAQAQVRGCQERLRVHYGGQPSSGESKVGCCHIGNSHARHVALGRQVFNHNTLTYWRRAPPSPVMAKLAEALRSSLLDVKTASQLSEGHWAFPDSFVVQTRGGPEMKPRFIYSDPNDNEEKKSAARFSVAVYEASTTTIFSRNAHIVKVNKHTRKSIDKPIDFVYGPENYAWGDGFKFTPSYSFG